MKKTILLLLLILHFVFAQGQEAGNLKMRVISFQKDTVQLDTLSIVPGSIRFTSTIINPDSIKYFVDYINSRIIFLDKARNKNDSITIRYRVFPILFTQAHQLRNRALLQNGTSGKSDPFYIEETAALQNDVFGLGTLSRSGSISRGITIGNNQDAVVNSSLNLQLSGKLSGDVDIVAAITDDNVPIQSDGNTQQLQEFDKVFIQLSNPHNKLIVGDFEVRNPDGYFMRYYKKGQGGLYNYTGIAEDGTKNPGALKISVGAAVSKGKFARNEIPGVESNQGPYRLRGAENENFIVILSGSEKVYLDGLLLTRGQDRDYVIDYNTAEVTFTTKRLITKDSRIIIEFQYSDKNYARTMTLGNTSWVKQKFKASLNIYSEQDSKNQPLQQNLSDADKLILANAGDNLSLAFAPNVDSIAFNVNEILYAKRDTIVNSILYSIYIYSTKPDSAHYRVGFSNVGAGKGNYIAVDGITNGRVYQWVAPVNSVPQGLYEPEVQLISPKQRQLITAGMGYDFNKGTHLGVELAASKDDINRFSKLDKGNDHGQATKLSFDRTGLLKKKNPKGWTYTTQVQGEYTDKNFKPVENYRAVEFTRDWNTGTLTQPQNELFSTFQFGIQQLQKGNLQYGLHSYLRGNQYKGLMHSVNGQWHESGFTIKTDASLLTTSGTSVKSSYMRHREDISKQFGGWTPGFHIEQEKNKIFLPGSDSLIPGSFSFRTGEVYLQRADSSGKSPLKISLSRRYDDGLKDNNFKVGSIADMVSLSAGKTGKKQRINGLISYRNLQVKDTLLSTNKTEESAAGKIDYSLTALKGAIQFTTYYEGGSGREQKKRYTYIQVAQGTGVYTWIDYNGDGIPQLNEFEVSTFQDQANYIRVFTPTDEYVRVFFNQFNSVLNITPAAFGSTNKKYSLLKKFSIQSSIRFDNRISSVGGLKGWNPVPGKIADSLLLSTQYNGRYSLYFNRNSAVFGADVTWQHQQSRQLLSNGIEARYIGTFSGSTRWNLNKWFSWQTTSEYGNRETKSEAFIGHNFNIQRYNTQQKFNIQPGTTYRVSFNYRYEDKKNILAGGLGEKANVNDAGVEWRFSSLRQGIISAHINLVEIKYAGEENTSIAYEMLEGLKPGTNPTWGLTFQRNLGSSLQVSINYEGRKPSGSTVIHTGGAQIRAFF